MREIAAFDTPADFLFGDPVALSPDGRWLIAASQTETRIWPLKGQSEKRTLAGHDTFVAFNTFSHDGQLLATAGKDKTVKLWDVHTEELVHTFPLGGFGQAVAFSPDDRLLAVGENAPTGTLTIWDVRTKQKVAVREAADLAERSLINHLVFAPDGKTLVVGANFGVEILDVERTDMQEDGHDDGEALVKLTLRSSLGEFFSAKTSISPDGRTVAFAKGLRLSLWDLLENREVDRFPDERLFMLHAGVAEHFFPPR